MFVLSDREIKRRRKKKRGRKKKERHATCMRISLVYAQVAQAHYERSAYIILFHFAYIMTSAKYKSLYEKCSKYALTLLRPELSSDNIWRSRQRTTCDIINFYDSRWFL